MYSKILMVLGTRPEAIKMYPLYVELQKNNINVEICITGQHKELLASVIECFGVKPKYDLSIMEKNQSIASIEAKILLKMEGVLKEYKPDLVLVHGDTTTSYASALAAFYHKIPIGHVEAGLRTHDIYAPFPEEFNRASIARIAKYHFAPTVKAKENLLKEGILEKSILVTGNTAIDAFKYTIDFDYHHEIIDWLQGDRLILVTLHRREIQGEIMESILYGIGEILRETHGVKMVFPVHPNPKIKGLAEKILGGEEKIKLVEPLPVKDFHNIMAKSHLILTDSGGIQEEAPSFQVPVLVLRDKTERPEGMKEGVAKLIGTDAEKMKGEIKKLLTDHHEYGKMQGKGNPYGDGRASKRIVEFLRRNSEDNHV